MNQTFQGFLFDAETLAARPVVATVTAGRLQGSAPEPVFDVSLADVRVSDRLADVPRYLYLPDGLTIETADNAAVDTLLSGQSRGRLVAFVHALEGHARVAAVATVLLVAATAASLWWGLPVLALRTAEAVPARIETQVGEAGLAAINRFLPPSQLGNRDRARVQDQLDRLMLAGEIKQQPRLVFRSMGGNSPNAFALPGGIIIFSDELVKLADSDEEIAAVLAHEIGHWQRRHGIQGVLRNSAALLVVSTVTGDLSTLTTFAGTIPFTLLQRGYSREFEAEADRYGVALLRQAGIHPRFFASILEKLEQARPTKGQDFSYLGTHPSTEDRIRQVDPSYVPGRIAKAPAPAAEKPVAAPAASTKQTPPRAIFQPPPLYPAMLMAAKISGEVKVEFTIDANGDVKNPRVVKSTDARFEAAALEAVATWKFTPGSKAGRNVAVRSSILLQFDADQPIARNISPASAEPAVPPTDKN